MGAALQHFVDEPLVPQLGLLPGTDARALPDLGLVEVLLPALAIDHGLDVGFMHLVQAALPFVFVRHAVDDDHSKARSLSALDNVLVGLWGEWRQKLGVLKTEAICRRLLVWTWGIVQSSSRFGIDEGYLGVVPSCQPTSNFQCAHGFPRTRCPCEGNYQGYLLAHRRSEHNCHFYRLFHLYFQGTLSLTAGTNSVMALSSRLG